MNKLIASLFAAALAGSTSAFAGVAGPAPTAKDIAVAVDEVNYVQTAQKGIVLSGYVDAGYTYNFQGPTTRVGSKFGGGTGGALTGPTAGDATPRGDFNLNALKIALEKPLTDENKLQAGFRADIMVGEDAGVLGNNAGGGFITTSGSDSVFLEQAYAQFRLPIGNGLDFKVGKFVTTLGYEVIERPANLNITYGNLFQNTIPLWHTGVLSSYKVNDIVDLKFGVVNGSNTDNAINLNGGGATGIVDNASVLAGINITAPGGNANISQNVIYSINGDDGLVPGAFSTDNTPYFVYDAWGNWTPKFANDKLLLAFNFDFGAYDTTPIAGSVNSETYWGAAVYAKYQFTDIFSLAGRADYLHGTDAGTKFGNNTSVGGGPGGNVDLWSYTLTAGFDVIENLTLRAEYRLDIADSLYTSGGFGGGNGPAHMAAVEVVYSF